MKVVLTQPKITKTLLKKGVFIKYIGSIYIVMGTEEGFVFCQRVLLENGLINILHKVAIKIENLIFDSSYSNITFPVDIKTQEVHADKFMELYNKIMNTDIKVKGLGYFSKRNYGDYFRGFETNINLKKFKKISQLKD